MSAKVIETIEKEQLKEGRAGFRVGDKVRVFTRVKEGDKERTQLFSGTVIARKGRGLNEQFTVRRISYGEGVERIFPLHSPPYREDRGRQPRAYPPGQAFLPARTGGHVRQGSGDGQRELSHSPGLESRAGQSRRGVGDGGR